MRSSMSVYLCGFALCVLWLQPVSAAEVTLQASMDNTLFEDVAGSLSNGAGQHFFAGLVGPTGAGSIRRGLLAFNVAGTLPSTAVITGVSLRLTMDKTNFGAASVSLYRANASWGEGASIAAGEGGQGAPAAPNDATWIHRFFNVSNWSTPGGDFAAAASATQSVNSPANYTWSSSAMVPDVQGWIDQPSTDFGWVIRGDETAVSSAKRFASRENAISASRPVLTVTYEVATGVKDWNLY